MLNGIGGVIIPIGVKYFLLTFRNIEEQIEKHHEDIKKTYKHWMYPLFEYPNFNILDRFTYDLSYIGGKIPLIKEHDGNLKTVDEMAVMHLNCKYYEESYTIYKENYRNTG